jgi:hypothetical protein
MMIRMSGPLSPREHLVAFAAIAARLRRGAGVGVVALAVGLAVSAALVFNTHRLYRSEATVTFERGAQAVGYGDGTSAKALAARVDEMLTSRQRLEGLIKEMKLYAGLVDKRGMTEGIDEMRRHLKVVLRDGDTMQISYDGESRPLARDVLDSLIRGVIDEDTHRRSREANAATTFLEHERQQADDDLKAKEAALSEFLTSHPQLAGEVGTAASGGLIRAADRDRAAASSGDVASLELQAAQIEESLNAAGVQAVGLPNESITDPALVAAQARAEGELQAARADLADKQLRLTNEHPDVKMALRRVSLAEAAVRHAAAAVAASRTAVKPVVVAPTEGGGTDSSRVAALKRALVAVRQQIASVRGRSSPRTDVPKTSGSMVAIDTEWSRLNREVAEAGQRQTQLQSKQFQAELSAMLTSAGEGARLVVADKPFLPMRPIAGGRFKIALAGMAGSTMLALLAMAVFAAFDDHLYGVADVGRVLNDGIVVVIPSTPRKLQAKPDNDEDDPVGSGVSSG